MPSNQSVSRILVNVTLDGALAAVAAPVARWIADPGGGLLHPLWFIAGGGITLLLGGLPFRLSQQYWRFSGINDLIGVAGGSVASAAMFSSLLILTGFPLPTITFPIIHAFVLASFLGAPRLSYRLYHGRSRLAADDPRLEHVLLIGAGEAADGFLRALAGQREAALRVTGIVALAERQAGRRMHGRPILGAISDLGGIIADQRARGRAPHGLVVADPDFRGARLADLLATAEAHGLTVQRAPSPTALTEADRLTLRPVAIEDLLNRQQVTLDQAGLDRLIGGRRVLVTGAGGSIGSELARQIAERGPAEIVLLDSSEYALWQIDLEFSETYPHVPRVACLADVRDEARIQAICAESQPELVFHAAALKHVPMVEANRMEGLLTNVHGTRIVADAARAAGAAVTVLISTDKAVNPTSLMGASKRLAEMYCQALDIEGRATGGMRCVTVRFGNVLGSTGSVVPLFRRQLERGGPLTVTHPDMQRYFMTVREAVALVLQACVAGMGEALIAGGDPTLINRGGIFVLDMGKPVRILDLARQMIVLAGLRPEKDVEIRFSGLRPGEKLFEELFHGREPPLPTGHPGLLMAVPRTSDAAAMRAAIEDIAHYAREGDAASALQAVRQLVPEFAQANAAGDVSAEEKHVLS